MEEEKKTKRRSLKQKVKKVLWFFANPRLLVCMALAWTVTNGWSYVMMGIGLACNIVWMQTVAGAYLAFLWFPFTPEKILTVIIAIALLRWLFPKDEKTLGILRDMMQKQKEKKKQRQD